MVKDPEAVMARLRQRMYDQIPEHLKGPSAQTIVDRFEKLEVRDTLDITRANKEYFFQLIFRDDQDNRWCLHRHVVHNGCEYAADVEYHMWESAMRLSDNDFAELALLLT